MASGGEAGGRGGGKGGGKGGGVGFSVGKSNGPNTELSALGIGGGKRIFEKGSSDPKSLSRGRGGKLGISCAHEHPGFKTK